MRTKGQRVYASMTNDLGREKRRYGTVASDEIEFWDYIDVSFDDKPKWVEPYIAWYLHDAAADDSRTGLVIFDADGTVLKEELHPRFEGDMEIKS
jgi:hypothetical protein